MFHVLLLLYYYTTASLWRDDTSLLSPVKRLASFFLPSAPMSVIKASSGSFISLILISLTSVSGIFSIVLGISARQNNEDYMTFITCEEDDNVLSCRSSSRPSRAPTRD